MRLLTVSFQSLYCGSIRRLQTVLQPRCNVTHLVVGHKLIQSFNQSMNSGVHKRLKLLQCTHRVCSGDRALNSCVEIFICSREECGCGFALG